MSELLCQVKLLCGMKHIKLTLKFLVYRIVKVKVAFIIFLISTHAYSNPVVKKKCTLYFDNNVILHNVALAETRVEQGRGLSGYYSAYSRMFFTFTKPSLPAFWMRNTVMPLSIGFFAEDGTLFQIEDMAPETDTHHSPVKLASGALELPTGKFSELNLSVGIKLLHLGCQ